MEGATVPGAPGVLLGKTQRRCRCAARVGTPAKSGRSLRCLRLAGLLVARSLPWPGGRTPAMPKTSGQRTFDRLWSVTAHRGIAVRICLISQEYPPETAHGGI